MKQNKPVRPTCTFLKELYNQNDEYGEIADDMNIKQSLPFFAKISLILCH